MEPLRRLPQMLSAALPSVSSPDGLLPGYSSPSGGDSLSSNELLQQLREVVREEVEAAEVRMADSQSEALARLQSRSTQLEEGQWETLGRTSLGQGMLLDKRLLLQSTYFRRFFNAAADADAAIC